ncbi:MAG TPA: PAS domain S-box protein [archaeon]|nr:PAS domain S-box protein [archaeon]
MVNKIKKFELDSQWYITTLKSIGDAVIATDKVGKILFLNSVAESLTGWSGDDGIGLPLEKVFNIINEETLEKVENPVSTVIRTGKVVGLANHTLLINKEGKKIPIDDSGAPIQNEEGDIIGVVLVFRDISERRQTKQIIRKAEEDYKKLFNSMVAGFAHHKVIFDDNGKPIDYIFLEINPAFEKFTGLQGDLILGKKVTEALPGIVESDFDWIGYYGEVSLTGERKSFEQFFEPLDKWYSVEVYSSERGYFTVIFTDITRIKKTEQELTNSERKYREAYNRGQFYKDLFAHDINNILQNVLSSVDTILLANEKPEGKEISDDMLKIITEQVNRGAKLVTNVRRLSEIDDTKMILRDIESFDLLEKAVKYIEESYKDKTLKITIDSENRLYNVYANELLLDVFENILINAVKHNDNTEIEIIIKITKEKKDNRNFAKFEFMDNGIGIQDERKQIVFERTNRISFNGMGLGLSLVNHIINKFEGFVWVEDRVKNDYTKGSNFAILIPEVT